jgi:hypothetical protein
MYPQNIKEEELKNKVAQDYFSAFDATKIVGNIDFCVSLPTEEPLSHLERGRGEVESILWAEAKKGIADIYKSIVQLILTIGKARTFDKQLPPAFLGAFDAEKIAFLPYNDIQEVFYQNDFNWNVTPSNHDTKEFKQVFDRVKSTIDTHSLLFRFGQDDQELREFIKTNFVVGKANLTKIKIDKNNFLVIYNKWLTAVKPSIGVNWEVAKKNGIIDGDFYLADLLSLENESIKDKLSVFLRKDHYELERVVDEMGLFLVRNTFFKDKQKAHTQFWNKYERPPKEEYWDYIIGRRDLLVPQDVRERKGSFFTPQIWVELSQKYIADVLGEDWQDEYYVWDCAAGTGNLLAGLTNKRNVWASTLDKQDVDVMRDRIKNGANLLEDNVFQFDFLNDDFSKLPKSLQNVINDPEKRKKLVIYINPPYAESNGKVSTTRSNIQDTKINTKYASKLGKVGAELYAQFIARVYFELSGCILAQFSKLKLINGSNSRVFRNNFLAKLEKAFVVPADTFDNVAGNFPIGFFIWDTKQKERIESITADIYHNNFCSGTKNFYSYDNEKGRLNEWLNFYKSSLDKNIGVLVGDAPDFQNNNYVCIQNQKGTRHGIYFSINQENLGQACIYLAVRHCIDATWLNDRDQFLYPNDDWAKDSEFQNDCLAYTLFHGQNRITSDSGTNHWIPFTEDEVNTRSAFDSNFMTDYLKGKIRPEADKDLFNAEEAKKVKPKPQPLVFSPEAQAVFEAGKALWAYYHKTIYDLPILGGQKWDVNASLYDIKEYFQGRNAQGKMNNRSEDDTYNALIATLRDKLKILAKKIEPKVYEYGFLKS